MLDAFVGEPPPTLHPVVWMGTLLGWAERRAPRHPPARFLYGLVMALAIPLAWGALAAWIERRAPWPVQAALLKPTFAGRGLLGAAERVERALGDRRLEEAQHALRWLVSRPTEGLSPKLASAAAIESVAENLVDSWLAPLLAYAAFGMGGAYVYRAANTADAMWGYRTPEYEWLGKAAARLDDLLNLVPSRLGALLLVVVSPRHVAAKRVWRRDAGRTASPNAGQTMAAMAGTLGVRLEKPDHYVLNAEAPLPEPGDVAHARRAVARAMLLSAGFTLALRRGRVRG